LDRRRAPARQGLAPRLSEIVLGIGGRSRYSTFSNFCNERRSAGCGRPG
jgi:hypothetical protein